MPSPCRGSPFHSLDGGMDGVTLRLLGKDRITGYEVFLLGVPSVDAIPVRLPRAGHRFVCLLAMDARALSVDAISSMAKKLLDAGCVYFCCWGPDCERVHDVIDEVIVGEGVTPIAWSGVMTTWHDKEPLKEAAEFFLWAAAPDDAHVEHCFSGIAIRVGNEFDVVELELEVTTLLNNPPSNPPLNRTARMRATG